MTNIHITNEQLSSMVEAVEDTHRRRYGIAWYEKVDTQNVSRQIEFLKTKGYESLIYGGFYNYEKIVYYSVEYRNEDVYVTTWQYAD